MNTTARTFLIPPHLCPSTTKLTTQTLLKKKDGHFRMLAEKAAGDLGMVIEAFKKGAAGMLVNGVGLEEENGGQEMAVMAK